MSLTLAKIIWVIGIIAWTAIRWPHRRRAKKLAVSVDRKSVSERTLLALCIVGLVIIPALYLATDWFDAFDYSFSPLFALVGTLLMVSFLVLFHLSHKQVGKNWSVTLELREDHKLITDGLYAHVRHPMYSSFWLWGLAQAFLLPNWIAGFAGVASVALLYFSRVSNEEQMMREAFGEEYDAYCTRTPRILPRIF